ncbi:conserved hypothetical protein [Pediculus humanus corporis]|uniref:EF-hand domain-containing protein n=1 Tax=Pediculus humanus subsp. corporis TaxID=121224 RepID=E0VX18_PEDHC|nr:uncharacterized protein Phum_PHUM493040 [Pediculus humanus corporis]EEB17924.1 conserved hypothetical protein [Pediculus humanus corporis]
MFVGKTAICHFYSFAFIFFFYDPEGFGEIPWDDFLQVLKSPDFITEVDANKREILQEKAQERKTSAITFQDFVNVEIRL